MTHKLVRAKNQEPQPECSSMLSFAIMSNTSFASRDQSRLMKTVNGLKELLEKLQPASERNDLVVEG